MQAKNHPGVKIWVEENISHVRYCSTFDRSEDFWQLWFYKSRTVVKSTLDAMKLIGYEADPNDKDGHFQPGVKVELNGAYNPSLHPQNTLRQARRGYCAVNSVHNAVGLSDELYRDLTRRGERLALSAVIHHLATQKAPNRVWCVRQQFQGLVDLVDAASGLALVIKYLGHVVAVDTSTRVIMDSDPRNPRPLELSIENLMHVGIRGVDLAYSLSRSPPSPLNPKKRKNMRWY